MAHPSSGRQGLPNVVQNAQAGAANGTAFDITDAVGMMVEINGVFTNITANFEASIDNGSNWWSVGLLPLTTRTRTPTATATGLYLLDNCTGLTTFRVRTTVASPTGSMTVKVVPVFRSA